MELSEFNELKREIVSQSKAITYKAIGWDKIASNVENHPAYESGQISDHFDNAFNEVLNPEIFTQEPKPERQQKNITLGNNKLTIAVGHMVKGLENVNGFDLIYYIKDGLDRVWKAVVFQHKKRGPEGSVDISPREELQKKKMRRLCGVCKTNYSQRWDYSFVLPHCSSLYVLGDRSASPVNVVSTCKLNDYLKQFPKGNFTSGNYLPIVLDRPTVDNMFLACLIGENGMWRDDEIMTHVEVMRDVLITNQHIVVDVSLSPNSPS